MRLWRGTRPHPPQPGAALVGLVIGGHSVTTTLTAAADISLLVIVLVIAVVAMGAAFSRSTARRRACLQALEVLLRLAPWAGKR
jgi:hypothetical protein